MSRWPATAAWDAIPPRFACSSRPIGRLSREMRSGGSCGQCHDGKQAFGIADLSACQTCHTGSRTQSLAASAQCLERGPSHSATEITCRRDLPPRGIVPRAGHLPPRHPREGRVRLLSSEAVRDEGIRWAAGRSDARGRRVRQLPRRHAGLRRGRSRRVPRVTREGSRPMSAGPALRLDPLHRLRRVQRRVQGGERPAAADRGADDGLHLDRGRERRRASTCAGCASTALEPTCVSVCPVAALQKTRRGTGRLRRRRAASAAATASWPARSACRSTSGTARSRSSASASCAPTASTQGLPTACAAVCPTGATLFGERDDARRARRARASRPSPGQLRRPRLRRHRGRRHLGAHALRRPLREARDEDRRARGSRCRCSPGRCCRRSPSFVGVWGAFLFGIHWITKRREVRQCSAYEAATAESSER